jgi:RimJ/RimL family protein N-acetyltransferase
VDYPKFRVYLESLSAEDAGELARNANDYEIAYNVASIGAFPYPYRIEDAARFIEHANEAMLNKSEYHFGVHLSGSGTLIGAAGILGFDPMGKSCSVGYWLGKEHWGNGYAKEAVTLLSAFSFKSTGIGTVYADVFSFNSRSTAMLSSIGFRKDQVFKELKPHYVGYAGEERYAMAHETFNSAYKEVLDNTKVST